MRGLEQQEEMQVEALLHCLSLEQGLFLCNTDSSFATPCPVFSSAVDQPRVCVTPAVPRCSVHFTL